MINIYSLILTFFYFAVKVTADGCQYIDGMYYCDPTDCIQFTGVGSAGSYNRVTSFNTDGTCSSSPQGYSGNLAPFDEELSVHFRGPIRLDNFKVFVKGTSSNAKRSLHHRHAEPEPEPIMVTEISYNTVFITVGGPDDSAVTTAESVPVDDTVTVSPSRVTSPEIFESTTLPVTSDVAVPPVISSTALTTNAPVTSQVSTSVPAPVPEVTSSSEQTAATSASLAPTVATTTAAPSSSSSTQAASASSSYSVDPNSGWSEVANYDAAAQSNSGCVFLNNKGGSGSGVFDYMHGSSLSYMAADGINGASAPECLSQTTLPSNNEFAIFSSTECQGDDCGYYRPGNVAYHGFGGKFKVFIFEFSMPTDSVSGFNADMPAVWLLNAQIPRNLQYGTASCSCWSTGCGEIDLWEILSAGNNHLVTTIHGNQDGGASTANYFTRPTTGTLIGAVIFDDTSITVVSIPEVPDAIDDSLIQTWISQAGSPTVVSM